MALMLRKECQAILNYADLDAFHVDMNPITKNMHIFTPCGKKLAVVHGVLFSTLKPTVAEIEFAAELLATWLVKNKTKIDNFTQELEILQKMDEVPQKRDIFEIQTNSKYSVTVQRSVCRTTGVYIKQGNQRFGINLDGKVVSVGIIDPMHHTSSVKLTVANFNKAIAYLNEYVAWRNQDNKVENILSLLNLCKS